MKYWKQLMFRLSMFVSKWYYKNYQWQKSECIACSVKIIYESFFQNGIIRIAEEDYIIEPYKQHRVRPSFDPLSGPHKLYRRSTLNTKQTQFCGKAKRRRGKFTQAKCLSNIRARDSQCLEHIIRKKLVMDFLSATPLHFIQTV